MPYSPAGSAGSPTLHILPCFLPDELPVSCLLLISISFLTLCFMSFVQLFLYGITILFFPCAPQLCVSCEWLWAFCRKGNNRDIYWPDLWEKSIKNSVNIFLAFWYFLASANFWFTFWWFYFFYSWQKLIPILTASFPCSTLLMLYQIVKRWLPFLCLEIQFTVSRRGLFFLTLILSRNDTTSVIPTWAIEWFHAEGGGKFNHLCAFKICSAICWDQSSGIIFFICS